MFRYAGVEDLAFVVPVRYGRSMTGAGSNQTLPSMDGPAPAIILVEPQMAENIGMAARAMANFGLSELRLVKPRDGWPTGGGLPKGAHAAASGAVHILHRARLYPDVPAAIADLNHVFATTARHRGQMKRIFTPAEMMPDLAARIGAGQGVGILFGRERTGLENDEISLADAIVTFPVNPQFASLNLAQAVLLMGYEWFRAARGDLKPFAPEAPPPAPREMVLSLFGYLEDALEQGGFFPPDKREIMARNLRDILHRLSMSEQDCRTLRGAAHALAEGRKRRSKDGLPPA
jgi:tRNA/rRNA methyltransferase